MHPSLLLTGLLNPCWTLFLEAETEPVGPAHFFFLPRNPPSGPRDRQGKMWWILGRDLERTLMSHHGTFSRLAAATPAHAMHSSPVVWSCSIWKVNLRGLVTIRMRMREAAVAPGQAEPAARKKPVSPPPWDATTPSRGEKAAPVDPKPSSAFMRR